jgi:hypothetical protein
METPDLPSRPASGTCCTLQGSALQNSDLWHSLLQLQPHVRDHANVFGLELTIDEAEGYAYLKQRPAGDGEQELPRLVHRRPLGYGVSLLLALIRKKLAEHDATGGDTRLILSRDQLIELLHVFMPSGSNEAKLVDRIDVDVNRIVELGFLRVCETKMINSKSVEFSMPS